MPIAKALPVRNDAPGLTLITNPISHAPLAGDSIALWRRSCSARVRTFCILIQAYRGLAIDLWTMLNLPSSTLYSAPFAASTQSEISNHPGGVPGSAARLDFSGDRFFLLNLKWKFC